MDILDDIGMLGVSPAISPMEKNLKLTPTDDKFLNNPFLLRRIISRLILNITRTIYLIKSIFLVNSSNSHETTSWCCSLCFIKEYLAKVYVQYKITWNCQGIVIQIEQVVLPQENQSWATLSSLVVFISWKTKKQATIFHSST